MELQAISENGVEKSPGTTNKRKESAFIEANTLPMYLEEIRKKHTIPVFVKDNVPAISQPDFIDLSMNLAESNLGVKPGDLTIRVSHPIKGRIFDARHKKAAELLDNEKTLYYERMAFSFDLPQVRYEVNGQVLTLTVVGVKSYSMDNLYAFGGGKQTFKLGIGFKVKVCTNMCLWSDCASLNIKARNLDELGSAISDLFESTNYENQIPTLKKLGKYELSEQEFAQVLGKTRMYNHLPSNMKKQIPELLISDTQVSTVTKQYFRNPDFMKNPNGSISLWNLFNLFTDSVKSSYIDTFIDRGVNAFTFSKGISEALEGRGEYHWFLS